MITSKLLFSSCFSASSRWHKRVLRAGGFQHVAIDWRARVLSSDHQNVSVSVVRFE